jgi:hypothetical protein
VSLGRGFGLLEWSVIPSIWFVIIFGGLKVSIFFLTAPTVYLGDTGCM